LAHERNDEDHSPGRAARNLRRNDRRSHQVARDEGGNLGDAGAYVSVVNTSTAGSSETAIRLIEVSSQFSGPLPSAQMLRDYEHVVPGTAARLVDAHLAKEHAATQAMRRLSLAETIAVIGGSIGAISIALMGIILGVTLIVQGHAGFGLIALIPGMLSGVAAIVSRFRSGSSSK